MRTPNQIRHACDTGNYCDKCGKFVSDKDLTYYENLDKFFCSACMEKLNADFDILRKDKDVQ